MINQPLAKLRAHNQQVWRMENPHALIAECEGEAIHLLGRIQPWGAMLVAGEHDLVVRHVSTNLNVFMGVPAAAALGANLAGLVGERAASDMLAGAAIHEAGGVTMSLPPQAPGLPKLALSCLRMHGALFVEMEPDPPLPPLAAGDRMRARDIVEALNAAASLPELYAVAMAQLRRVLGFDRVLLYRFDVDHHGEVIGDDHAPDMESLLGLHFPAEDIPPAARRIFSRVILRVIGDTHAAPVALLGEGAIPDLSLTALRAPSACHLEYLRNMGSHATATVALHVNGALWGILAAHHRSPMHVVPARRALCELIGQVTALKLANLRDVKTRETTLRRRAQLQGMAGRLAACQCEPRELATALAEEAPALLSLCNAEGMILRLGGRVVCCGRAPPPEQGAALLDALMAHARQGGLREHSPLQDSPLQNSAPQESARQDRALEDGAPFAFHDLGAVLGNAALTDGVDVAGALLLPLSHNPHDALVWLRPEQASVVCWGGDPRQSISRDPDTSRLRPRGSFAVWRQDVSGRSRPWTQDEQDASRSVRGMIQKLLAGYTESMRVAREVAERATRAKSEFLATMSHEIRSPLSGLIGVLELLRSTELNAAQRRKTDMIHNSASMLLAVLNDILDFSKIEAGALSIAMEPVELGGLLRELAQTHGFVARRKEIDMRSDFAVDLPVWVSTDRLRLSQILGNLLSNAVKFTARGQVSLHAEVNVQGDLPALRFRVRDSGIGMTEEVLARLFAPFMQADGSTTRTFGGTGLGLCISHQLARLLGGDLSAASVPGAGSEFSLTVPLVARPPPMQTVAEPIDDGASLAAAGAHILVVDDDPTIRWLSQRQIEKLGLTVDSADDGEAGLQMLQAGTYDLLLTDCHMPRMDGVALTRAVRALPDPALGGVPIIGLTADVTEGQRCLCHDAGMTELVTKPLTLQRLTKLLRLHLPARAASAAQPHDRHEPAAETPALRSVAFEDQIFLSIFEPGSQDGAQWLHEWLQSAQQDIDGLAVSLDPSAAGGLARETIRLEAHRLAGSAFSVGAMLLGEAARALELASGDGAADLLRELHQRVQGQVSVARAAIMAFLAGEDVLL